MDQDLIDEALGIARDNLYYQLEDMRVGEPVECPCCGTNIRYRKCFITSQVVRVMLRLYELSAGDAYDFHPNKEFLLMDGDSYRMDKRGEKNSSDVHYLEHWHLVTRKGRGYYALTDKGVRFVEGKIAVKKAAVLFNGEVVRFEGASVEVLDRIEEEEYREAMRNVMKR